MKKSILVYISIIFFVLCSFPVFAQDKIENGILYVAEGTIEVPYAKYRRNETITEIIFPASLKRIGYEAFRECTGLKKVSIPENVAVIDNWAFAKCTELETVEIAEGVTSINEYAFYGDTAIKEINVPGSISVIGKWAFGKCENLAKVVLNKGVSMIVECAFYGCTNLSAIEIPETVIAIGKFFPSKTLIIGKPLSYAHKFADEKNISFMADKESDLKKRSGLTAVYPSQKEIKEYVKTHPFYEKEELQERIYDAEPVFSGDLFPGVLSAATKNSGLNAINTLRFIAGLKELELDDEYGKKAQNAVFANAVNGTITNNVASLKEMSEGFNEKALEGAKNSNLAKGLKTLPQAIIRLNRDSVTQDLKKESMNHRKWILNPAAKKTGFGIADNIYAQYCRDTSLDDYAAETRIVVWPPENMIAEFATSEDPFTVMLSQEFKADEKVSVLMKRNSDGKTWKFDTKNADGYFKISKNGNDVHKTIITWKPENIEAYKAGDVVSISVRGLKYNDENYALDYYVNYFDAYPHDRIEGGKLIIAENKKIITTSEYKDNSEITCVEIGPEIKEIRNWAFAKCMNLEEVVIANGVEKIGECAFYGDEVLKSVTIPESVCFIGNYFPKQCTIKCKPGTYAQYYAESRKIKFELIKE